MHLCHPTIATTSDGHAPFCAVHTQYFLHFIIASAAPPTEQQLFHHVACKLGDDWKPFAIYLGFESTQIQQADKERSLQDKAYDILVAWRKGTGNEPKTWATILTALERTKLTDLACEIQRDVERGTLFDTNSLAN